MPENYNDVRQTGIGGLSGLSGISLDDANQQIDKSELPQEELDKQLLTNIINQTNDSFSMWDSPAVQQAGMRQKGLYQEIELPEGFGDSRFDRKIRHVSQLDDLNEFRANQQSGVGQIANGLIKGTVLAGTTFLDGTAGTVAGIANTAAYLVNPDIVDETANGDRSWRGAVNAFVSNPFSQAMQEINKKSEELLPNYYTQAELEDPWYQHIFSANFIGDKVLKNFGFMVGAYYSGKVATGALSKVLAMDKVRDAFKGVVTTASGKELTSAAEIARAYKTGDAFMDGAKLTEDLAKAAKQLRNAEWTLKGVGAITAAMGEGRIEAISNSNDWFELHKQYLDDDYQKSVNNIMFDMGTDQENYASWFQIGVVGSPETGYQYQMQLTDAGQQEFDRRQQAIQDKYDATLAELKIEQARLANAIFGLNLPLLAGGNLWQWGRFLTGGYNTGRLANKAMQGQATTNLIKSIASPFWEGLGEEMGQSSIAESMGLKQAANLNEFYGAKLDPEANGEAVSFLSAISQGFGNIYGDINNYEEAAIGFLSAAIGMPSLGRNSSGKLSLSLNSEWREGIKEYREETSRAEDIRKALDARVSSDEFRNLYEGYVRHGKYQQDMDNALSSGDKFNFHNAETSQIISDIIMFDKAGRLQELYDLIDSAGVTLDDVEELRNMVTDESGKSLYASMSDDQVVEHINKQVSDLKNAINNYSKVATNLKVLYGENIDSDLLQELTYDITHIDSLEERYKQLWSEMQDNVSDSEDNSLISDMTFDEFLDVISTEKPKDFDKLSEEKQEEITNKLDRRKELFNQIKDNYFNTKEFTNSVDDLIKISNLRNEFINKYQALSQNPELFTEENRQTREKMQEQLKDALTNMLYEQNSDAINNIKTVSDLRNLLSRYPSLEENVLKRIENSKDNNLIEIARRYKNINAAKEALDDIISSDFKNIPQGLKDLIDSKFNSGSLIDNIFAEINTELSNSNADQATKDMYNEIKSRYDGATRSQNSTQADNTPPSSSNKKANLFEFLGIKKGGKESTATPQKGAQPSNASTNGTPASTSNTSDGKISVKDFIAQLKQNEGENTDEKANEGSQNTRKPFVFSEEDYIYLTSDPDNYQRYLENLTDDKLELVKDMKIAVSDGTEIPIADKLLLKSIASIILKNRQSVEAKGSSLTSDEDNTTDASSQTSDLRSWTQTEYVFDPLKDPINRKLVDRSKKENADFDDSINKGRKSYEIVQAFKALGMYDFVNKGFLADELKRNPDLKIHLVQSRDDVLAKQVLLAIEIDSKKAINAQKGNDGKTYQIVGSFGYSNSQQGMAIFNKTYKQIRADRVNDNGEGAIFVSSLTSNVEKLFSGRIAKSDEDNAVQYKSITKNFLNGSSPVFAIYKNGQLVAMPFKDNPNIANLNMLNTESREGSVWLLTKAADGKYYPKALTVKRFTESEFPFEANKETPIMKKILGLLEVIADPAKSNLERTKAKVSLDNYLYGGKFTGEQMIRTYNILYGPKGVTVFNPTSSQVSIGSVSYDSENKAETLAKLLMSPDLNLRFQVSENSNFDDLIDSGIFLSDLLTPFHVNASFSFTEPIVESPVKKNSIVQPTAKPVVNNVVFEKEITINEKTYKFSSDGTWSVDGKQIKIRNVEENDMPAILDLMYQIKFNTEGTISNSELYSVLNSNPYVIITKATNRKYSIKAGKIISNQKEIESFLNQLAKSKNQIQAANSLEKQNENEEFRKWLDNPEEDEKVKKELFKNISDSEEQTPKPNSLNLSNVKSVQEGSFDDLYMNNPEVQDLISGLDMTKNMFKAYCKEHGYNYELCNSVNAVKGIVNSIKENCHN